MHMAYFQEVSVILHDESHHLLCIAKNLCRFSFVAMLRQRSVLLKCSGKCGIHVIKLATVLLMVVTRILQNHSAVM